MKKLITTHNAGFFSCCSIRLLDIIRYFNKNKELPEEVDSSAQWQNYKNKNEDITFNFFEHYNKIDEKIIFFEKISENDYQFDNYNIINFEKINPFIKKYFSLSESVNDIKNSLINEYNIDLSNSIGVFYRSGDKITEMNILSKLDMIKKVKSIKDKYPNHKIIVQSDEQEFYDLIKTKYPDIIEFKEIIRLPKGKIIQPPYFIAQNERVYQSQLLVAIMYILANCNYSIFNSGNMGIWLCYFRGNNNNTSQYVTKCVNDKEIKKTDYWQDNE